MMWMLQKIDWVPLKEYHISGIKNEACILSLDTEAIKGWRKWV